MVGAVGVSRTSHSPPPATILARISPPCPLDVRVSSPKLAEGEVVGEVDGEAVGDVSVDLSDLINQIGEDFKSRLQKDTPRLCIDLPTEPLLIIGDSEKPGRQELN